MNEIFDYFEYNESSKTCLIASKNRVLWNGKIIYSKGDEVGCFTYRKNGDPKCIRLRFNNHNYHVHNLIWEMCTGQKVTKIIDHIDGNPFNNKIDNLREVDFENNARNVKISSRNKTGVVGVCLTSTNNGEYTYYEAFVSDLNRKLIRKKFPFTLHKEIAFKDACNWRKEQLELLNALGAGYTERHGK
jgi:hypothetical protein